MSHGLGDDVVVRHQLAGRRITVLEETLEHGDLLGVVKLASVHLRPQLVDARADELHSGSIEDQGTRTTTYLSHDLVRVAHLTPAVVGDLADEVPRPGGDCAALPIASAT